MKVRIVIRLSTVQPADARQSIWNVFKQIPCRLAGHRGEMKVTSGKMALKCARCGWESPGWTIDLYPRTVPARD